MSRVDAQYRLSFLYQLAVQAVTLATGISSPCQESGPPENINPLTKANACVTFANKLASLYSRELLAVSHKAIYRLYVKIVVLT